MFEISTVLNKQQLFFKNCLLAPKQTMLLLGATNSCAKSKYFKFSESVLEIMPLKYEITEKLTFEIFIWVKQMPSSFKKKMRLRAPSGKCFPSTTKIFANESF